MQININDYVKVKLTDRGREILKTQHEDLRKQCPFLSEEPSYKTDEDGWSQFQMWDLMVKFGPYIFMGCDLPFETTVEFSEESC